MAPTLTHGKSGRTVTVPDGSEGVYLENGWSVAGITPAPPAAPETVVVPGGDPTDKWKVKELAAYAESHGIDLAGASKKDEILAAIASSAEKEGTDAEADTGEGDTVPSDADDGADD